MAYVILRAGPSNPNDGPMRVVIARDFDLPTETPPRKFTSPQLTALRAARDKGGAWYERTRKMGGSYSRMCEALVKDGLLDGTPPYALTPAGREALAKSEAA